MFNKTLILKNIFSKDHGIINLCLQVNARYLFCYLKYTAICFLETTRLIKSLTEEQTSVIP